MTVIDPIQIDQIRQWLAGHLRDEDPDLRIHDTFAFGADFGLALLGCYDALKTEVAELRELGGKLFAALAALDPQFEDANNAMQAWLKHAEER